MFILAVLVQVFLHQVISGEEHCSRSLTVVKCVPCSDICPATQKRCNTTYYYCPDQCGKSIAASECLEVCDETCRDGRCEYVDERLGLVCIGCKSEFTGQICQEFCHPNCKECDQFDSTCITCTGNYLPPYCTEIASPKATSNTTTPTTTNFYNCSANCRVCHIKSGDCDKCSHGYYGRNCETLCTHCNISQCAVDTNCIECISNLSRSECVTAWTEYKITTSSLVNCTETNCHQVSGRKTQRWLKTLICGLLAAVLLTFGSICIWRKMNSRY